MNREPLIQNINIDLIIPNRFQPRLTFDEKTLNELAASIKEHGIIQPLVLRRLGDKFEIIAGERRYKAATLAGLTEVPAIISNIDDNKSAELALVENVQRKNLNSLEEAKSYKKILDKEGLTQEELAKKIGVSQSTVANKLRLLNLTMEAQDALMNEKISERHARSLLTVTDPKVQVDLLNRVINERLTVRQLDDEIKKLNGEIVFEPMENPTVSDVQDVQEQAPIFNEEQSNPVETLDIEEPSKEKNKFNLFNFEKSVDVPSLEDEITNMNIEPIDKLEEFNPFNNVQSSSPLTNDISSFSAPLTEVEKPEETVVEKKEDKPEATFVIKENNLDSVKEAYNKFVTELKNAGYNVSSEDFDFEDLYQMIIKIEKADSND